jgi:hypothetical protein
MGILPNEPNGKMGILPNEPNGKMGILPNEPNGKMDNFETNPISPGETLPYRLVGPRRWMWTLPISLTLGLALLGGSVTLLWIAFRALDFRDAIGPILLMAVAAGSGIFGFWILLKCVEAIVVAFRVKPTVVEVSTRAIVPGQSVELVVAQAGPLRSKSWRVALIGQEHTIEWGRLRTRTTPRARSSRRS